MHVHISIIVLTWLHKFSKNIAREVSLFSVGPFSSSLLVLMLHETARLLVCGNSTTSSLCTNAFFTYTFCRFIISGVSVRIFACGNDEYVGFIRKSEADSPGYAVLASQRYSISGQAILDVGGVILIRVIQVKWADLRRGPPRWWYPCFLCLEALLRVQNVLKSVLPYLCLDCVGLVAPLLPFKASGLHSAENCFDIATAAALWAHFCQSLRW